MKVPVRYRFQWHKTTVDWLQRATWRKRCRVRVKSITLLQSCKMKSKENVVVLKCKKKVLFEKTTEMSTFILCFSEISKVFICFCVREFAFLCETWKKVVRPKKCPYYGFQFSRISPWLFKCVKGTHIENGHHQTCLPFSARYPR